MAKPNTLDEQIDKILDRHMGFPSDYLLAGESQTVKELAKQQLKALFTEHSKQQLDKSLELMQDILMENFHYRTMCGEIKDPTGKIDIHKAFVEYQELEPERKKFAQYIEAQLKRNKGEDNE